MRGDLERRGGWERELGRHMNMSLCSSRACVG